MKEVRNHGMRDFLPILCQDRYGQKSGENHTQEDGSW